MGFALTSLYNVTANAAEKHQSRFVETLTCGESRAIILDIFLSAIVIFIGVLAIVGANGIDLGPFNFIGTTVGYSQIGVGGSVLLIDFVIYQVQHCKRTNQLAQEVIGFKAANLRLATITLDGEPV